VLDDATVAFVIKADHRAITCGHRTVSADGAL
jgi:hypothetical protein